MNGWTEICDFDDLIVDRGAVAMVDGIAVAVFRPADGRTVAIDNHDPISRTSVLSRGLLGSKDAVTYVASPMYEQHLRHRHQPLPRRRRSHHPGLHQQAARRRRRRAHGHRHAVMPQMICGNPGEVRTLTTRSSSPQIIYTGAGQLPRGTARKRVA